MAYQLVRSALQNHKRKEAPYDELCEQIVSMSLQKNIHNLHHLDDKREERKMKTATQ